MSITLGTASKKKVDEVVSACAKYGKNSIIALAGVPGTGKSYLAEHAAQVFTNEPTLVREIQFHQSFTYEEFIEGPRIDQNGSVSIEPGVFLEWNERANEDPKNQYVLLVEELTRANLPAVLGELLTFIEYRGRKFVPAYSRRPTWVAKNLTILATYNPTDRTAIELDNAILRRLRIIRFPPSTEQLREMLTGSKLSPSALDQLVDLFDVCRKKHKDDYEHVMPFGHGIFAGVTDEKPDLNLLWTERIEHLLRRPLIEPHPFTDTIARAYPWRDPTYAAGGAAPAAPAGP